MPGVLTTTDVEPGLLQPARADARKAPALGQELRAHPRSLWSLLLLPRGRLCAACPTEDFHCTENASRCQPHGRLSGAASRVMISTDGTTRPVESPPMFARNTGEPGLKPVLLEEDASCWAPGCGGSASACATTGRAFRLEDLARRSVAAFPLAVLCLPFLAVLGANPGEVKAHARNAS